MATLTVLLAAGTAAAADGPPPFALTSSSVTLPSDNRIFPGGKDAEAANANCLTCHSAGMVLNQPPLTRAAWDAEVRKMVTVYKAPIQAGAIPAIVAYLAATKGAP